MIMKSNEKKWQSNDSEILKMKMKKWKSKIIMKKKERK